MYVDESGDTGTVNSNTDHFVLSALVLHESEWLNILDDLILFRRGIKAKYGLKMKDEIHTYEFVTGRPNLSPQIPRNIRLDLLKSCMKWLASRNDISIVTVMCLKGTRDDVFNFTWKALIQRFDNTLKYANFPGGHGGQKGMLLSDDTDAKLTGLIREMRRFNPVPSMITGFAARDMRLKAVVEDPVFRDSAHSYLHQMADVVAYFGRQYYEPNRYVRRKGARTFYNIIQPVTNPHVTHYNTPNNIVEI